MQRKSIVSLESGVDDEPVEQNNRKVSYISSENDDLYEVAENTDPIMQDLKAVSQLITHIPDMVINFNQNVSMPAKKECIGVAMFADISGFTALCEKYADMVTKDSSCGTDKLTATLNNYIGKIVDCIIKDGGDVLKFAGDAILASWLFSHSGHNVKTVLTKAICCGISIQEKCDNQMTGVGVLLRVKIAIAIGSMIITFVGTQDSKQFDLSGSAIDEVGAAEKHANPSDIILTHLAWTNSDQNLFNAEQLADINLYKVSENKRLIETQRASQDLFDLPPGIFSEMKGNGFSCKKKKVVICPELDQLIAQCPACNLGLPKALLPDTDDIDVRNGFRSAIIPGRNEKPSTKEKRFDRQKMSFMLPEKQVKELRAYVAKPVLDKLKHGQDLEWLSEMRQVSVLFINMKLPGGDDDPAKALQKAFEAIYDATLKYEGNLNKVFSFDKGCTFIVIFGLPGGKHEDDGYRSLLAGHMIYESLHELTGISDESIGVTTGRAFCGVVGHKNRHEYTVIGRKVNMAARLMTNYPGKLSCDPETFEAAKIKLNRSDFVVLPFKALKGIKDPGIIREYYPSSSIHDEVQTVYYPILGRENEIDEFSEILEHIKTHKKAATSVSITIEGEAGIGKSRLLDEFMDIAEEKHFRLIFIELNALHETMPYYAITAFISMLLNLEDCTTHQYMEQLLYEIVDNEMLKKNLYLLNNLFGSEIFPNPKDYQLEEEDKTSCLHNILLHIVNMVAERMLVVLFVDNAQFIDADSWEVFHEFATRSCTIMVLAMRPFSELQRSPCQAAINFLKHIKTKRIMLKGLPADLLSDLACQMLEVYCIPQKLNDILRSGSKGNPSQCERMVKKLMRTNVIQTGPPSAFDFKSENEQNFAYPNASPSVMPIIESQCECPSSSSIKRARSVIRHIFKELKTAGNVYPAPSAHILSLGDTLKQETERVLTVHNRLHDMESQKSVILGTPVKFTSLEPENTDALQAGSSEHMHLITNSKMSIGTESIPILHTVTSENIYPITNIKKISLEAENNSRLHSERPENMHLIVRSKNMSLEAENDAKLHAEISESINSVQNNKMSLEPENHFLFRIDRAENVYPIVEQKTETIKAIERLAAKDDLDLNTKKSLSSDCILYNSRKQSNYIYASGGTIPINIQNVCILSNGREVNDYKVQTTDNNILIARLDRMSPNEQLILKCASILGMNFTRELLSAIIPRKTASVLDKTLYKLSKERLIECGSFALSQSQQHKKNNCEDSHDDIELNCKPRYNIQMQEHKQTSQVLCGCYANEGSPTINLTHIARQAGGKKKLCLYFHFTDTIIRESAYDLWLEDQRHALHERAAIFLENQTHLCKSCGGTSFVPVIKSKATFHRNSSVRDLGDASMSFERKLARAKSMSSTVEYRKESIFRKATICNSKIYKKDEVQNDTGYYQKQTEAKTRGDFIGEALIEMAENLTSSMANKDKSANRFKSFTKKILKRRNKVIPDTEAALRAAVTELQKMIVAPDRTNQPEKSKILNQSNTFGTTFKLRAKKLDVSECQCSQVLAVIYPQLVFHWKASKNRLKTFTFLIETIAALTAVHSNTEALSYVSEAQAMITESEGNFDDDSTFFVSTEDKARIETLTGQALMSLDRTDEAIKHFVLSLKHVGNSHPHSRFGTLLRTFSAYMAQVLHRKMPNTFKERNEESSVLLVEEARCLTHLSHAYKVKNDYQRAYMVALEQLNAADEGNEDCVELMNAYSNIIHCCQLTRRAKLGHIYEELSLKNMKQEYNSIQELLASVALYANIMSFRLNLGKIVPSVTAGYEALQIAKNVNDVRTKIEVIPLLSQALLLISRVQACHEVLHDLRKAASDLDDLHGKAGYYCGCMELILEQGRPVESFKRCLEFSSKIAQDSSLSSDVIVMLYLPASISVMLARQKDWLLASSFHKSTLEFEPEYPCNFFYCRAYAKIAEFNLLRFRENRKNESIKARCKEVLKKFKLIVERHCVLLPRLYHLQAYFAYLQGQETRAKILIDDCIITSRRMGPMFEEGWAISSRSHWFSKERLPILEGEYEGKSAYILPR